jgi:SAM-dependent methyltransferase
MTDWTAGYVADIGYTFGYYTELNPLRAKLAFLDAGLVCPDIGTACELGFGQGLSTNMHAAATVTRWSGTDFNPAQAGFAQELSEAAGTDAKLYDEAFEEFAGRSDLPEFDYIGLHGIWSWISDDNRRIIVDFVRKKLKVGGVLYISYNTQPGWASFAPMRHLMTEHAAAMGSSGAGIVSRIDGALDFADKLMATNPIFSRANPTVGDRVKALRSQNRHYLAHEYFNRDWHPMHFATMAQWLEPAKVSFACSANFLDHVDAINLSTEQQTLLKEIPDAMFRETVRDFMVNQQFRKDYWVKGERKLSALDKSEGLRAQQVLLTAHRADVSLKVSGALGEANMQAAVYNPILDALADHKAKSLGQLEALLKDKVPFAQIVQAILVLCGAGHLSLVQDAQLAQKAKKTTDRLNQHLIQKARSSAEISYLTSPVTGGGIVVPRFAQLFLQAITQGKKQPAEWAQHVWQILAAQGQRILKEGKTLESIDDNLVELTEQAQSFAAKQLPILKALQIV